MRIIKSYLEAIVKCTYCESIFAYTNEDLEDTYLLTCPCCSLKMRYWLFDTVKEGVEDYE